MLFFGSHVYINSYSSSGARIESAFVMMCTVIVFSTLFFSKLLGQFATTVMHHRASKSFAENGRIPSSLSMICSQQRFAEDCQSNPVTTYLSIFGEILGIIIAALLYSWSIAEQNSLLLNDYCCFFYISLICVILYVLSLLLFVNDKGEFARHPSFGSNTNATVSANGNIVVGCCVIMAEVLSALASDVLYLANEIQLSSRQTSRRATGSDDVGGGAGGRKGIQRASVAKTV